MEKPWLRRLTRSSIEASSVTALKKRDAVLPCTPSLVRPREPNHQRPYHAFKYHIRKSEYECTYDDNRKSAHEHEAVECEDPDGVLALDNPLRDGDADAEFLLAVGMTVLLQVLADGLISQPRRM